MNKCVTTNSNVQRIYVTELYFILCWWCYCNCTVLFSENSLQTRTCLLSYIICYCSLHMPLACLITSSASMSSPARLLHQPMLCLRFLEFQTLHGNSDGGHGFVLHQPMLCLRFSAYQTLHGNSDGEHGAPHFFMHKVNWLIFKTLWP